MTARSPPNLLFPLMEDHILAAYFKARICKPVMYADERLDEKLLRLQMKECGTVSAGELREKLLMLARLQEPVLLKVAGCFSPNALLSGIDWKLKDRNFDHNLPWHDPILQRWLFSEFDQVELSWDINDWPGQQLSLVGQIGERDESDSICVLVKGERKTREVRTQMERQIVAKAVVRGLLCHESHLKVICERDPYDAMFFDEIKKMTYGAKYFLILLDSDKSHEIQFSQRPVEFYSGFIWQCWTPKEWLPHGSVARLPKVYFLLERTNFALPDVMRYSLDSLNRKVDVLRARLRDHFGLSGDLKLLHRAIPEGRLCDSFAMNTPERDLSFRDVESYARVRGWPGYAEDGTEL